MARNFEIGKTYAGYHHHPFQCIKRTEKMVWLKDSFGEYRRKVEVVKDYFRKGEDVERVFLNRTYLWICAIEED